MDFRGELGLGGKGIKITPPDLIVFLLWVKKRWSCHGILETAVRRWKSEPEVKRLTAAFLPRIGRKGCFGKTLFGI